MDEDVTLPQPDDWATESVLEWRQRRDTQAAAEFRESVCQRLPTHVCAVCAQYRVPRDVQWYCWSDIAHRDLLKVEGTATAAVPRCGHTK
eukprot:52318-Eustigmatos_ZCMA.PRE.1